MYTDKGVRTPIDYYYPEVIEAQKELGLLPKDFIPPALSPRRERYLRIMLGREKPKSQLTEEQNRKFGEKLSELIRANARGDKAAKEKANRELDEIAYPNPAGQTVPPMQEQR